MTGGKTKHIFWNMGRLGNLLQRGKMNQGRGKAYWMFLIFFILFSGCSSSQNRLKEENQAKGNIKMGLFYLNENNLQAAFLEYQKALEIIPKDRDAHYALGHIYFNWEKYSQAIMEFETVLSLNPKDSEAHNYLGKVYEKQEKWDQAITYYQKALSNPLYKTPDIAHYNLGIVKKEQKDYEGALISLKDAFRINPQHSLALFEIGQVHVEMGNLSEAISAYRGVIKNVPNFTNAHYQLGLAYQTEGSKTLAAGEFERVVQISPNSELGQKAAIQLTNLRN